MQLGSGFLVNYNNAIFLVTAHHVLEALNKTAGAVAYIGGVGVDLSGLKFIGFPEDDVVVAHLDHEYAKSKNLEKVKAFPLNKEMTEYKPVGYCFFMGYPSSRNSMKKALNKYNRNIFGYSLKADFKKSEKTMISNHSALNFDIDMMSDTSGNPLKPPALNGISGGPLFEIFINTSDHKPTYALNLIGVFSEWRKKQKEIVCANTSVIIESANEWFA